MCGESLRSLLKTSFSSLSQKLLLSIDNFLLKFSRRVPKSILKVVGNHGTREDKEMIRKHITVVINYNGRKKIELEVAYDYHKGTTLQMGDAPTVIEPVAAIDGTGSDVLGKLHEKYIDLIEDAVYNDLF